MRTCNVQWGWPFPLWGEASQAVQDRLAMAMDQNIDYEKDVVLGFPGTTPLPEAVAAYHMFLGRQPNNIGYHTGPTPTEIGFAGTQGLEREVICAFGSLAGAGPDGVDGYVCSGGSEGNDCGIWMGSRRLTSDNLPRRHGGIVLLTSWLAHYSVKKHYQRLLDGAGEGPCGNRMNLMGVLPTNQYGELTPKIVAHEIKRYRNNGFQRFLLVLNAGTISMGSVDQIAAINAKLLELKQEDDFEAYIHVDGAFGGMLLPFLEPDLKFGFQNELVGSVSIDAHKMGYVPYGAGIFLCRKGYLNKYTRTDALYLGGHADYTVSGSRSGAAAAACWAAINALGSEGYRKRAEAARGVLDYLQQQLAAAFKGQVFFYPSRCNIQAVRFSEDLERALKIAEEQRGKSFCIPTDTFPTDFARSPLLTGAGNSHKVHRFLVTPTVTKEKVDIFISSLREALQIAA
jgi:tyrosine decarboxylase/aspartate 1-decarboxylase